VLEARLAARAADVRAELERKALESAEAAEAEREEARRRDAQARLQLQLELAQLRQQLQDRARAAAEEGEKLRREFEAKERRDADANEQVLEARLAARAADVRAELERKALESAEAAEAEREEARRRDAEARLQLQLELAQLRQQLQDRAQAAAEELALTRVNAVKAEYEAAQREAAQARLEADAEHVRVQQEMEQRALQAEENLRRVQESIPSLAAHPTLDRVDVLSSSGKSFEKACRDVLKSVVEQLNEEYRRRGRIIRFTLQRTSSVPHKGDLRIELFDGKPKPVLVVVVECKDYTGPIPQREVEKFEADINTATENEAMSIGIMMSRNSERFSKYPEGPQRTARGHHCHFVACHNVSPEYIRREICFFLRPHVQVALRDSAAEMHPMYGLGLERFRDFVGGHSLPALEKLRDALNLIVADLHRQHSGSLETAVAVPSSGRSCKRKRPAPGQQRLFFK
jgi:hypothetical protein